MGRRCQCAKSVRRLKPSHLTSSRRETANDRLARTNEVLAMSTILVGCGVSPPANRTLSLRGESSLIRRPSPLSSVVLISKRFIPGPLPCLVLRIPTFLVLLFATGLAPFAQAQAPPQITSADNTTFAIGTPGTFGVTTAGFSATPALTEVGALPSGVSFTDNADGTATITGTPQSGGNGSNQLTITASDGVSQASQDFTLIVPPAITSSDKTTFTV